ncbi:MAG: hypothetical protein M1834_002005 [Cirrosporium novae-zelandiae]|nr:MAG: hypothetical protein M1834_002005 [Cirrosporium novae-zelandiae]
MKFLIFLLAFWIASVSATIELFKKGQGRFKQLIDHDNPSLGTFSQRYRWNRQHWAGPGSPIILSSTQEEPNDYGRNFMFLSNGLAMLYAKKIGGAILALEHRYYGKSSPYKQLTVENLQYLTVKQVIADLTYFANNVVLPFDKKQGSHPSVAPWVLMGGSYTGVLVAWTAVTSPGTFWAYHASSSPVQVSEDFWKIYLPIQEGMPRNCSKDVTRVMTFVDAVLQHGSQANKTILKSFFSLEDVKHDDDFASALVTPLFLWQKNSFTSGYSQFFQFCDSVEGTLPTAPIMAKRHNPHKHYRDNEDGVGFKKAITGYANWISIVQLPTYCSTSSGLTVKCLNSYPDASNSPGTNRQWLWLLCNEPFEMWLNGPPIGIPAIGPRVITTGYWKHQCSTSFPSKGTHKSGIAKGKTAADVNSWTRGWDVGNTTRLMWSTGQYDTWLEGTVSSRFRPGGPLRSTPEVPIHIIPGGFHCTDLRGRVKNAGMKRVLNKEIAQIAKWVGEWEPHHKK